MATRRTTSITYKENTVPSSNPPQPTRLIPQQMDEIRAKGICFNCDNKYSKGDKRGEKELFYIDCEEEVEKEKEPSQAEELERLHPKKLLPPYLVVYWMELALKFSRLKDT